ncbi:hypothetical protein D3C72_2031190 [compost metagenome]
MLHRKVAHQRRGDAADVVAAEHGGAQRQHRQPQPVVAGVVILGQVAELGQGIGQPRHGGFRQVGPLRQYLVGQCALAGLERRQHAQATGQRSDEQAVFFLVCNRV